MSNSNTSKNDRTCNRTRRGGTFVLVIALAFLIPLSVVQLLGWNHQELLTRALLIGGKSSTKATAASSTSTALALQDSLGFFDDIPDDTWKQRRYIARHRKVTANPWDPLKGSTNPRAWYQMNWEPNLNCLLEDMLGNMGDGHKWVCDPYRIEQHSRRNVENGKPPCLVYSIGSNGAFDFEQDVQRRMPSCEIHTFDYMDFRRRIPRGLNITYHEWGLKPSYHTNLNKTDGFNYANEMWKTQPWRGTFKTFQETVAELGHAKRTIDIFKIDCEGCEWYSYKDWIDPSVADVRQILVEVHDTPPIVHDFFRGLHNVGFAMFHKEPNIQWSGGNCVEFAFLKMANSYFRDAEAKKDKKVEKSQ